MGRTATELAERWRPQTSAVTWAVRAVTVAWGVVFAVVGVLVHESFNSARYDLGIYVQIVRNTAHGDLFEQTLQTGEQASSLGIHVEPVLLLLAPLWVIWSSPLLLVVLQPLVLAAGALPAYWLGRKHLGSERLAAVFAVAYLMYPATQFNAAVDFHAVSLAPAFVLYAIWYLDEDRLAPALPFLVLAASTKEQMPLLVAMLGVYYWVSRRRHARAAAIVVPALAWLAISALYVIPHLAPPGVDAFATRYADLGGSPLGLVETILTDPGRAARELNIQDLAYGVFLGLPFLGLWALTPLLAIGALPELGLSVLSSRPQQISITAHYTASAIPFIVAASILGAARLSPPRRIRFVHLLAAVTGVVALVSPLWAIPLLVRDVRGDKHAAQEAALALVPQAEPVTATNQLGAHLSDRRRIYTFPQRRRAEWVVVDLDDRLVADVEDERLFARTVRDLRRDRRFLLVYDRERVLAFRRVVPAPRTEETSATAVARRTDRSRGVG